MTQLRRRRVEPPPAGSGFFKDSHQVRETRLFPSAADDSECFLRDDAAQARHRFVPSFPLHAGSLQQPHDLLLELVAELQQTLGITAPAHPAKRLAGAASGGEDGPRF